MYFGRLAIGIIAIIAVCGGGTARLRAQDTSEPTAEEAVEEVRSAFEEGDETAPQDEDGEQEIDELDALLDMVVTISRRAESSFRAPFALSVVTDEDIARHGINNIPEAIRLVPGFQVARINAQDWAISGRGFNSPFANKLLVMMDGRSVYDPVFSGVFWSSQDTILEDIDRIEVIRGPGGAAWGANAVNGVVNILTKRAEDTQGTLFHTGLGNYGEVTEEARYGFEIDDESFGRVFVKFIGRDGKQDFDQWRSGRAGFRLDFGPEDDGFTVQGDVFVVRGNPVRSLTDPTFVDEIASLFDNRVFGGNVIARWTTTFEDDSQLKVQFYWDYFHQYAGFEFDQWFHTVDVDSQYDTLIGERNRFQAGVGYRLVTDSLTPSGFSFFDPGQRTTHLFTAFVNDRWEIVEESLFLSAGVKAEHNSYTGFEFQPNARLAWHGESQTAWAAVSRSVRTPNRSDHDIFISEFIPSGNREETNIRNGGPIVDFPTTVHGMSGGMRNLPGTDDGDGDTPNRAFDLGVLNRFTEISGNRNLRSEELWSYEIGYRIRPADDLLFDVAAFYNVYNDVRALRRTFVGESMDGGITNQFFEGTYGNELDAEVYGVEFVADWRVTNDWRLRAAYTFLNIDAHVPNSFEDLAVNEDVEGQSPNHQVQVSSYWDISDEWELNAALFWVDSLPALGVPSYVRTDLQVAWHPNENVTLRAGVRNLFEGEHREFGGIGSVQSDIPTSVYFTATITF